MPGSPATRTQREADHVGEGWATKQARATQVGLDPALEEQTVEGAIERALLDIEDIVRESSDGLRDFVTGEGRAGELTDPTKCRQVLNPDGRYRSVALLHCPVGRPLSTPNYGK